MSRPHRIWRAPVLLGAVTAFGLALGLMADGPWDLLAAAWRAWPRTGPGGARRP